MVIGLLECDHVREELRHIAGDYRQMFPALFAAAAPHWKFRFYDVCNGKFPDSVEECDAYICTGSKSSVYDSDEWIVKLKNFVLEISRSESYFIGVCFGHQILGEALGGKVQKSDAGWCVGVHTFETITHENWMDPGMPLFKLLMMCQDQVLTLPPQSTLLAATTDCKNAAFTVGKNMLGIQAHPEFPKDYNKALMELRIDRIGKEKVEMGIESLKSSVDDLVIAKWICNFVERKR